ncbi:epimerase [Paenibacillus sp. PK3_47]|uniref:NAD-dependent epimerase/dehydratase family protein n=1 Tax=Paenibacillus sp. PK3_47 TaxID=2072642 RepID=UPI00201D3BE0|nr:NAD-dependent epimerase/dehydratase family protein [Paenibacillus sp. PK3_47]UQZ36550.1 epimerase [Paenibacillus sp. PK3_47]
MTAVLTGGEKIRAVITGATGMVGEGVLHECLAHPEVEQVLSLGRRACGISHPKLTEILLEDLSNLSGIEERLKGYNACYFCLGTTSAGMTEAAYTQLTHGLTLNIAGVLAEHNPGMVFCYVTAAGTDRTEQGRSMWARVKGKTENSLLKLPFSRIYFFRPGFIRPTPGLIRTHRYYKAIGWMYPLMRFLIPKYVITLQEMGRAMIHVTKRHYSKDILESRDMAVLAEE